MQGLEYHPAHETWWLAPAHGDVNVIQARRCSSVLLSVLREAQKCNSAARESLSPADVYEDGKAQLMKM
jgi:hypothetical protein